MAKRKIKKDINHESILNTTNNQTEQQECGNGLNNIESNTSIETFQSHNVCLNNTTKENKSKLDDFKEFCDTKPKDIVFQNEKKQSKFQCLSADILKIIALLCMLIDHSWISIATGNDWMNYIGRIAFPIFAFQIVEGYFKTANLKKYKQRLFIFALISEIPFNLFISGGIIYPFHQNVIFTFLLGIIAMEVLDIYLKNPSMKVGFITAGYILLIMIASLIFMVDYTSIGVLTILTFYASKRIVEYKQFSWARIPIMIVGIIYVHAFYSSGRFIPIELFGETFEFCTQGFAVLSLIPILLYNGKKGKHWNIVSKIGYWFYPAHLFLLFCISSLF